MRARMACWSVVAGPWATSSMMILRSGRDCDCAGAEFWGVARESCEAGGFRRAKATGAKTIEKIMGRERNAVNEKRVRVKFMREIVHQRSAARCIRRRAWSKTAAGMAGVARSDVRKISGGPGCGGERIAQRGRRAGCAALVYAAMGAGHVVVDGGGNEKREDHGDEQSADDGNGERLKHLRAGADGQRERKHSGDGGDGGHGDGAKTAAAGLENSFFAGEAGIAEFFVGVEKQDAVFGDDADDHDEAHERGKIESDSGGEQSDENAGGGKHRGDENGNGRGEIVKFKKENEKDENNGESKDEGEVVEGLLLGFVEAAVLDADGGRQIEFGERGFNVGDAVAHVEALEAGGDGDVALFVVLKDFGLAGEVGDGGKRAEIGGGAGGADDRGVVHGGEG